MKGEKSWFISSSIKAIKNNKNLPMSADEIWKKTKHTYDMNGKTPVRSLAVRLCEFSKDSPFSKINDSFKSKVKYFEIIQDHPQKFKLIDNIYNSLVKENDITEVSDKSLKIIHEMTNKRLDWNKLTIYNDWSYRLDNLNDYTYIGIDRIRNTVKIGYTARDPETRINEFRTGNPDVELVCVLSGNIEKDLHKKFDRYRVSDSREWFFYTKEIKEFIDIEVLKNEKCYNWYIGKKEQERREDEILKMM